MYNVNNNIPSGDVADCIFVPFTHPPLFHSQINATPDNKFHGASMGPTWGRQDPYGPHVGRMGTANTNGQSTSIPIGSIQQKHYLSVRIGHGKIFWIVNSFIAMLIIPIEMSLKTSLLWVFRVSINIIVGRVGISFGRISVLWLDVAIFQISTLGTFRRVLHFPGEIKALKKMNQPYTKTLEPNHNYACNCIAAGSFPVMTTLFKAT